jgi:hypothetical protein
MAASQDDEARSLFNKHFAKFRTAHDKVSSDLANKFEDLEEFRRDLTRCPRIAFQTCSSHITALEYVLILPGMMAQVVEEILTINPEADYGYSTFHWVVWAQKLDNLSADILRILLERGRSKYIIGQGDNESECPLLIL